MNCYTCCICGKTYIGYPHNAEPIKKGICCFYCNKKVIKARIEQAKKEAKE